VRDDRREQPVVTGRGLNTGQQVTAIGAAQTTLYAPTYKQAAYEALRDMIIELELPPGERLVEADLAARLGVSKTPVREAIALLESDGFVEIAPYRGASVTWLTVAELMELNFLLDTIEIPALTRVVEMITREELAALAKVVHSLKLARAAHDGRRFRNLTIEYHRLLLEPARFRRIVRSVMTLVFPVGLRYDRVFGHNFDDTWDLQLELMVARYEGVRRHDAGAAAEVVRTMRARIQELYLSRLTHPLVAPYLRTEEGV
jgi:GntR family transcriptional regulator, rspAB operon transcriptional repressor